MKNQIRRDRGFFSTSSFSVYISIEVFILKNEFGFGMSANLIAALAPVQLNLGE
jgi:hypothetical protein